MTSRRYYIVRTDLGYVLIYNRLPTRLEDGDWPAERGGRIHTFSPHDVETNWLALELDLPAPNVVRSFTLDPAVPGRLAFRYRQRIHTIELLVCERRWWWPWRRVLRFKQPFCENLLRFAHITEMPVNVPVYWVWA